jgi:hypothetical protein
MIQTGEALLIHGKIDIDLGVHRRILMTVEPVSLAPNESGLAQTPYQITS